MPPREYTTGADLAALLRLARGAQRIIEFGTASGCTTLALARANPDAIIATVDVDEAIVGCAPSHDLRPFIYVGEAFHGTPEAARIRQAWTRPSGPHDLVSLGGPFDFAFVDSLHTYEGVKRDTDAAMALGCATIVWDDYLTDGVPVLLGQLKAVHVGVVHAEGTRLSFWRRP